MSKRVLILFALGIVAIIVAILTYRYEHIKPEAEADLNLNIRSDPNRFKKGYRFDRPTKTWVPVEPKTEYDLQPEIKPVPDDTGNKIS
jgi:hypothetical protein